MTPIWTKSRKNKMKQEKALVSWDATNAVKHRPAVPFGVVLKMGCWCCFGENDSICAMVEPFRWCFQRCQKCFWDVYSNSSLLEKMISYIKNPSWTSSLFCGMLCVKEGKKNMAKKIPSLHSYKDGIFLLYHIKKFILLECILSMVCILYLQRHLIWFPSNYFYI